MDKATTSSIDTISRTCIAVRLRLLNRVVTNFYDDALRPLSLKVSQLNILIVTAKQLTASGIPAVDLHGNLSQAARQRNLAAFSEGHSRVLVATDIAARGIDVEALSHVVNFDVPNVPEDYIHRVGRTGRAANGEDAKRLWEVSEELTGAHFDLTAAAFGPPT